MGHGKYEAPKKPIPLMTWFLIILAVLGMSFGGVMAYLSASTPPVKNTFDAAVNVNPTVTDYCVDVGDPGYAVYVRAMVVVNWKNADGNVLAVTPSDTEYTIEMNGEKWFAHTDGFWYYKEPISSGATSPLVNGFSASSTRVGYTLEAEMVVQTVQALGTTDADNKAAVEAAWGIPVSAFTN